MAELTIRTRTAAAGLAWVRAGLRLFARRPLVIVVLVAFGPLLNWTLGLLPIVGTPFALILFPTISIGMLAVCRAVDEGAMPGLASYTAALRDPFARFQLLKIGVYYALVIGTLLTVWSLLPADPASATESPPPVATAPAIVPDGSAAPGALPAPAAPAAANEPPAPDLALTPARAVMLLTGLAILVPLQMTIWFAPALVAWHRMPASKALFFSFFACWRNRAPLLVFLLALFGLACIAVLAFAALIGLLNAKDGLAQYLLAPPPLLLLAITQTSTLAMYRDVVVDDSDLRGQEAGSQEPGATA
ncbi:putative membrane protein [Burkholderiales bacterium]|nr:putative membrane protein [Burkholderiales bacterium]